MKTFIDSSKNNHRHIRFDGLTNFRDIGGLQIQDGRTMKPGIIFRSDELSRLSRKDLEKLRQFKFKLICDLRTPNERKSKLARIPHNEGIPIVNVPIYWRNHDLTHLEFFRFLTSKSRELDMESLFKKFYHRIVLEETVKVNEVITLLSDKQNLPALIHCTTGKDRTGIISALIQLFVGVPREKVLENYLFSNVVIQPRVKKLTTFLRWMSLFQISPERLKPVLEVRSEYLDDILDSILKTHGTIEDYFIKACSINQGSLQNLKQLLRGSGLKS